MRINRNPFGDEHQGASMENVVAEVKQWYRDRAAERMARQYSRFDIRSQEPEDPIVGAIEIIVETPSILSSITLYNRNLAVLKAELHPTTKVRETLGCAIAKTVWISMSHSIDSKSRWSFGEGQH
jgi:hypothetical protein